MMKPTCRLAGSTVQLRYGLPYDIQCSTTYPITSPNGSSVILLGHSQGLYIVWQGGRPLRARMPISRSKGSTLSDSDVMVIDLDEDSDDGGNQADAVLEAMEPADFEDEEEEVDPRRPYAPIVQTLDLPLGGLGGGVTHIAVPLLSDVAKRSLSPEFLSAHMLVTVACTDSTIRLLTIPLSPPSNEAKSRKALFEQPRLVEVGQGTWGESMIEVPRSLSHRTLVNGLAIGVSSRSLTYDADDRETEGDDGASRNEASADSWDILIASSSADIGGVLLVHRVPIGSDGILQDVELWRRVLLDRPSTSIDLHPGSTAGRYTYPRVLIAEANGPVQIYECSDEESKDDGRMIGELFPSKAGSKAKSPKVLSARFILGGQAVMALLDDGEWGVWDASKFEQQTRCYGFTYGGRLSAATSTSSKSPTATTSALTKPSQQSAFAPMTPHTRKVRQQALFADSAPALTSGESGSLPQTAARGSIALLVNTRDPAPTSEDGHALIWYGASNLFVSNLRANFQRHSEAGRESGALVKLSVDPFSKGSTGTPSQPRLIQSVDDAALYAGARLDASFLVNTKSSSSTGVKSKSADIVAISERALGIIGHAASADATRRRANGAFSAFSGNNNNFNSERGVAVSAVDALSHGAELAIDGIEGVLDGMARGARRLSGRA